MLPGSGAGEPIRHLLRHRYGPSLLPQILAPVHTPSLRQRRRTAFAYSSSDSGAPPLPLRTDSSIPPFGGGVEEQGGRAALLLARAELLAWGVGGGAGRHPPAQLRREGVGPRQPSYRWMLDDGRWRGSAVPTVEALLLLLDGAGGPSSLCGWPCLAPVEVGFSASSCGGGRSSPHPRVASRRRSRGSWSALPSSRRR